MWDPSDWLLLCSLDVTPTSLLLMYSGCGVPAEVVHGAFPWAALSLLAGPGELAAGSVQATLDLSAAQLLQLWFPLCRWCVTSINIKFHQPSPTRDFYTWRWFLFLVGGGPVHKRAVFFQWEKYRYKLTLDPCALASTPFLQIVQLRKNERVDEGQG